MPSKARLEKLGEAAVVALSMRAGTRCRWLHCLRSAVPPPLRHHIDPVRPDASGWNDQPRPLTRTLFFRASRGCCAGPRRNHRWPAHACAHRRFAAIHPSRCRRRYDAAVDDEAPGASVLQRVTPPSRRRFDQSAKARFPLARGVPVHISAGSARNWPCAGGQCQADREFCTMLHHVGVPQGSSHGYETNPSRDRRRSSRKYDPVSHRHSPQSEGQRPASSTVLRRAHSPYGARGPTSTSESVRDTRAIRGPSVRENKVHLGSVVETAEGR